MRRAEPAGSRISRNEAREDPLRTPQPPPTHSKGAHPREAAGFGAFPFELRLAMLGPCVLR
jgi:hypothetical protein